MSNNMNQEKIERIISLIFNTSRIVREHTKAEERPDPFSWVRRETLRYISERDEPAMNELATYLHIARPSATSLVNALAKKGLVKRVSDKKDRRSLKLSLTKKGEKALEESCTDAALYMKSILSKLKGKDLDSFISILERIAESYQK
jgi:DNA-binding MarR family transcriptional regulator